MPSKRPHTKSRLGCAQCKQRHIRCRGTPPSCSHCTSAGLECEFLQWKPAITAVQQLSVVNNQIEELSRLDHLPSDSDCSSSFSLADLGLVHHFTLHAAATLPVIDDPDYYIVWTRYVPRLAASHACLSHALLAFAGAHRAFHSSAFDSSASDIQLARQHYGHALETFRTTVTSLDAEHEDVLLPFCILTCFVTIRMDLDDPDPTTGAVGVFVNLLKTVRLSIGVLEPLRASIDSSPLRVLRRHLGSRSFHDPPADLTASLDNLDLLIETDPNRQALLHASAGLRSFFGKVRPYPDSWALMLQWLTSLQSEFDDSLQARNKIALCLLAHWCVPAFNAPSKWYTHGWPKKLMQEIAAYLSEVGWQAYIEWPLAETLGLNTA